MSSACLEEYSLIIYGNIYHNPVEMTFFQLCALIDNQGLRAALASHYLRQKSPWKHALRAPELYTPLGEGGFLHSTCNTSQNLSCLFLLYESRSIRTGFLKWRLMEIQWRSLPGRSQITPSVPGSDLSWIKGFCYIVSSSQKQPRLNAQFVLPTVFRQIQLLYSHLGGKLHCWVVI